jgi:cyanophycinase
MSGPIALVGGAEWMPPTRDLDGWLLERSGAGRVAVLPTATARGRPDMAVETARNHFEALGAKVEAFMILDHADAEDPSMVEGLRESSFIYLGGGDPRWLTKVMQGSAAWKAILQAHDAGAVLAGSSAGAMALCEKMLIPRWTRWHKGLGVLKSALVIPHHDAWINRVTKVVTKLVNGTVILGIDEGTGLVLDGDISKVMGPGSLTVYRDGKFLWSRKAPADITEKIV